MVTGGPASEVRLLVVTYERCGKGWSHKRGVAKGGHIREVWQRVVT